MLEKVTAIIGSADISSYYPLTNITVEGVAGQDVLPVIDTENIADYELLINGIIIKPSSYVYNGNTFIYNNLEGFDLNFDLNTSYVYIKFNGLYNIDDKDTIIFKYYREINT